MSIEIFERILNSSINKLFNRKDNIEPFKHEEAYLVAVDFNNPTINIFNNQCFNPSILLSLDIFQIIGVYNSYDKAEFSFPSLPMMKPREMLRLLKDRNISIFIRYDFRDISYGKNASFIYSKLQDKQKASNFTPISN